MPKLTKEQREKILAELPTEAQIAEMISNPNHNDWCLQAALSLWNAMCDEGDAEGKDLDTPNAVWKVGFHKDDCPQLPYLADFISTMGFECTPGDHPHAVDARQRLLNPERGYIKMLWNIAAESAITQAETGKAPERKNWLVAPATTPTK